jgi:outer membrane protein assembly factor BamA
MKCLVLAALLVSATACTRIPRGQTAVDRVDVTGNTHIDDGDIEDKIATSATPKFMGVFRGVVYDYVLYDRHVLAYDLARVERYYRARGYYEAHARAGRVIATSDAHVRVEILVDEGQPVVVREIHWRLDGPITTKEDAALKRAQRLVLPEGKPLEEDKIEAAQNAVKRALEDHGYAKAIVKFHADVDLATHTAAIEADVHPAEKCVIGPIRLEGLGPLPEHAVRRDIELDPGEPFTRQKLQDAERRLLDRGVVTSVNIEPDLEGSPHGIAPLVAKLQPSRLHEVRLGGGFELEVIKSDVHLKAAWQDKNFLGDLRRFSAEFTPGVVLYPTRISNVVAPTDLLPEEKLRFELRQPGFIERRSEAFVRPELNSYPVLIRETFIPNEPVIGYLEAKTSEGVERTFWHKILTATLSHSLQYEWPFAYKGTLDPTLTPLLISYVELRTSFDFRNDRVHPRKGIYFLDDLQVAGLGGQPQDVRVNPELRGYVPAGKRVTFAARAAVGFDFPFNYDVGTDTRDLQIVFFRGFFSGGPSQNRGYPTRGIGPRGDVGLFNPLVNQCLASQFNANQCAVPLGGLSLWEASVETRVKIAGPFSGVVFCDAADVSAQKVTLHFDRPHLSCGLGGRYDTPIGPVRADVGYRIPGAQVFTGQQEYVPELIAGVPITISLGLGEAF